MNNQKKIEDLLISINELILEAKKVEELDIFGEENFLQKDKILSLKNERFLSEPSSITNKIDQTNSLKKKEIQPLTSYNETKNQKVSTSNKDWNAINFDKYQKKDSIINKNTKIEGFNNRYQKLFEECLNNWIDQNLKKIIEKESNLFAKKLISEKLK
tara:strand:+ start:951 stop:1424 length:474 start_codon:yes stop_codon:yes gene_type:complete